MFGGETLFTSIARLYELIIGQVLSMGKRKFQDYIPDGCHRRYSCVHCRAHLANHDELISKVAKVSLLWEILNGDDISLFREVRERLIFLTKCKFKSVA